MSKILIVEDDDPFRHALTVFFDNHDFTCVPCRSAEEGFDAIDSEDDICVVVMDQNLPGLSGLEALSVLLKKYPDLPTVFLTADPDVAIAVKALKMGAYDYLIKPIKWEVIHEIIIRAKKLFELTVENKRLSNLLKSFSSKEFMVTQNKELLQTLEKVKKISHLDSSFLITGESGVGKELMAKAIHAHSNRSDKVFIDINCAAMSDDLLTSSLFGFEKGAFTGATQMNKGCFEEADGGTLFLDEIGNMSARMQAVLLRVLQEKQFSRLGSYKTISTDFRLITATNNNLDEDMANNLFREDLYYRINVTHVNIPPLRERPEDIPILTKHFIGKWAEKFKKRITFVQKDVSKAFHNYPWPGNIRELQNVIEYAVAMCDGKYIKLNDLPEIFKNFTQVENESISINIDISSYSHAKNAFHEKYFRWIYLKTNGDITEMARITGVSRPNVYRHLKSSGISIL